MSQSLVIEQFPLTGSHLIEASAGTGKTFTIALLYVRLVLGHGGSQAFSRELLPNEILVVTFTDAASMELRARIRERLAQAARVFSGIEAVNANDPLQAIIEQYPASEHIACAQKLQRAAEWMDEAAVSTIHSWCYRMLREHAFNSGSLFTNSLVEDHSALWQDVVNDLWRRHFYQTELSAVVLQEIHLQWQSPAKLAPLLKQLAKPGQHQYRLNGAPLTLNHDLLRLSAALQAMDCELQQHAEQLRQQFVREYQQITDCLISQWENFNATSYKKTFAEKFEPLFLQWRDRGELAFDLALFSPAGFKLKKGKPAPEHAFFEKITPWLELREKKAALNDQLTQALLDLQLQLAVEAQADFERQLLARAELGFDDLLRRLAQALDGPQGAQLQAIIRRQFPVAFIDEFQDTDPLQYQIFQRIYQIDANRSDSCFVMIGDPKQAIYAFRGADIYTYLQARKDTQQRHYTLSTNFRSTEQLVTAVNGFFSRAEQDAPQAAFRFANGNDNPVPFEAVASGGRREVLYIDDEVVAPVNVWFDPEPQGIKDFRQLISEAAASDVVRWLNLAAAGRAYFTDGENSRRPLLPKDLAVLVRGRTEAQAIREALAARRVASVYLSNRDSVFDSPEAQEVYLWLQAVWQVGDDRSLRAALAVPSMGLTDAQLAHYADDELAWESLVNQVRSYRELWIKRGVLPMLQRWLHDFKVAVFLLSQTNGERRLTNLLHISEWLQQRSVQLDSELALIDFFQQTLADPPSEQVLRLESDDDLVKVVTIHKSKGLEYPVVLLPFIGSWRTADGRQFHEVTETGYQSVVDLGDKKHFQAAVDAERLDEDVRLLYVALTRARHALWLGVAPLKARANNKAIELHQSGFGYVLAAGKSLQSSEEIAKALSVLSEQCQWRVSALPEITDVIYHPPEKPALGEAAVAVKHYEPWWIASYSGLRYGGAGVITAINEWDSAELERARELRALEGVHALPQALVPGVHGLPKGARTGNTLHEMMELYFAQAPASDIDHELLLAQIAARRGFDPTQQQVFVQLVLALLERPLPLLRSNVVLAETTQRAVELEFWFAVNHVDAAVLDQVVVANTLDGAPRPALVKQHLNGMLKGFIDLVFEADGRYYVLDWKSNTLGESDLDYHREKIIKAMAESRYDLQLSLYLLALHRHLKQRLADYDYEQYMGGALYWFVRGINTVQGGMYIERPPKAFIETLDELFQQETVGALV